MECILLLFIQLVKIKTVQEHLKVFYLIVIKVLFFSKVLIELSQITGVNMSSIKQAYKRLDKILKDNMTFSEEMSNTIKRASNGTSQIIPRMVENLELPSSMSYNIKQITIKSSPFLEGKRPSTIAAASLLLYLRNSNVESANAITDKDVATAANCHISTLKSAFSVLSVNKDSIFVN